MLYTLKYILKVHYFCIKYSFLKHANTAYLQEGREENKRSVSHKDSH